MTPSLEAKLREALAGTALAARADTALAPLVERRAKDPCVAALQGSALMGLARAAASSADAARYLSSRPQLLEDVVALGPDSLAARTAALPEHTLVPAGDGLEGRLDAIRLLRRDETLIAACCVFGGLADFAQAFLHLSILAERCVRHALDCAEADRPPSGLAVMGMGKIAGREFTFGSDLDLIFLHDDAVGDVMLPARTGQRLISYLTTMTGAGVAYAVDSRLRPSGGQGTLVSTLSAFERYQTRQAALWEHLALMRSRAIAGDVEAGQRVLDRARDAVLDQPRRPWREIAEMRARVESERADAGDRRLAFKAGAGGLMDVEFLAAGGRLERGAHLPRGTLPAIPTMLRASAGDAATPMLERYAFLRRVEACTRWTSGRAVEALVLGEDATALVAELVEPGLSPDALATRLRGIFDRNRRAFRAVVEAGSLDAIAAGGRQA